MSKIRFNEHQRSLLERNPNVQSVSDRAIQYKPEFKIQAVHDYRNGKGPSQIFREAGFDLEMIGSRKAKSSLSRWRKSLDEHGEAGLFMERRGTGSTGRPSTKDTSPEEKLKKAEARIQYLEAEVELLKKLEELERQAKRTH